MHDIGKQNIITQQTVYNHGHYSIAAQVQRDKTAQMQRENAQNKQFWDNHNSQMQKAWSAKPNSSTPQTSGGGGSADALAAFIGILFFLGLVVFVASVI